MTAQINQDDVNLAVWSACDTFRGTISSEIYKDYVLTVLFLKYLSYVWRNKYEAYRKQFPSDERMVETMLQTERFVLPHGASFYTLYEQRFEAGNGERINKALRAIEEANTARLDRVFQDISFNSTKLGGESQKNDLLRLLFEDFHKPALDLRPKTKGDYTFIPHMIETMKPEVGRMAVVAPHRVLFRGAAGGKIRAKLGEENLLDTVIGLPEKLFFGTGIPATILVFRKRKSDDRVLFIDASCEYADGKNQNLLRTQDVRKIAETCQARHDVEKYAHLATLEEIRGHDYNLNIPRYVDTFEEEPEIDLHTLLAERAGLKAELERLVGERENYLKELSYVH
jgi:type I restriction enzyme M protein